MKPVYQISAWQEDGWWLARVMAASEDADPAPVNALTQARSLAKIEPMARDLIATILDATEDDFEVEVDYTLPGSVNELVYQARGARAWLDAAQDLWQERSVAAARELTDHGYSLRETAALLGLSHQRVDQLLSGPAAREQSPFQVFHSMRDTEPLDLFVVVRHSEAAGDMIWPSKVDIQVLASEVILGSGYHADIARAPGSVTEAGLEPSSEQKSA